MKYIVTLNGKKYEVEVEEGQATAQYVGVAEAPAAAPAPAEAPVVEQRVAAPAPTGSGDAIRSPMPGTILKVNAVNGARVKAGDILFVLEAMKMENEIVAPKDGVITSVATQKGASVETDAILATIQ
ncbi:MAG: biotin/lipoyl-binding protein [Faecalicoccus sp.]|nr:biotin/lipoyl-binding protein [Faecalicoccus sp.]